MNQMMIKKFGIYSSDYGLMSTPLVPWSNNYGNWFDHFNEPTIYSIDHKVSGIVEINAIFLIQLMNNEDW